MQRGLAPQLSQHPLDLFFALVNLDLTLEGPRGIGIPQARDDRITHEKAQAPVDANLGLQIY